ncbi:hypothetical protein ACJX0J_037565, partial [Zea mays]
RDATCCCPLWYGWSACVPAGCTSCVYAIAMQAIHPAWTLGRTDGNRRMVPTTERAACCVRHCKTLLLRCSLLCLGRRTLSLLLLARASELAHLLCGWTSRAGWRRRPRPRLRRPAPTRASPSRPPPWRSPARSSSTPCAARSSSAWCSPPLPPTTPRPLALGSARASPRP